MSKINLYALPRAGQGRAGQDRAGQMAEQGKKKCPATVSVSYFIYFSVIFLPITKSTNT
jgi:hypothetical protein